MAFVTTLAGVEMPPIIYGTAWKKEATSALVTQALRSGFRAVDTACQPRHYREELVGEGIRAAVDSGAVRREELFIQTKYTPADGQDPATIPYDPALSLAEQVRQSCRVSRENLRIDRIDSLLLHSPLFPYGKMMEVWRAMEELVDEGHVRQIGISNLYDLSWHQKLFQDATIKPAVIQNRFYAESGYDKAIRMWALAEGIVYQSFWSLTANPHLLGSEMLLNLARHYGKTPAQIFFAYLNARGIVPLIGTTSQEHMKDDLEAGGMRLLPEEAAAIDALL